MPTKKAKSGEKKKQPPGALDRSFGPNLRRHRRAAGYTQEELADRAGLHRTQISLLERGLRNPGLLVLARLAGALEVEPNALFEGISWWPGKDGRKGRFSYRKKTK
jgi:transcriptional regulator with XRE-family HTH domain